MQLGAVKTYPRRVPGGRSAVAYMRARVCLSFLMIGRALDRKRPKMHCIEILRLNPVQ